MGRPTYEELTEALRPFAEYEIQQRRQWGHSDNSAFYGVKRPGAKQVRYGDFRRASRVFNRASKPAMECVMIDEVHVMMDLETWGVAPGCAIRSIGAVEFCPVTGELGDEFYINVSESSCLDLGLVKDPGTVSWWSKQSKEAQDALLVDPRTVDEALTAFTKFWQGARAEFIWSQGGNFDEPILGAIYTRVKRRPPWKFHNSRDTRTSYHYGSMLGDFSFSVKREGTYHNALDDAKHQARCVHLATRAIRKNLSGQM
jgi:hypothetical protein